MRHDVQRLETPRYSSSRHSHRKQLAAIGFDQIQEKLLGQLAVARRASGEEEQRVLLTDWIGLLDFVKELAPVFKLRLELGTQFGPTL